MNTRQVSHDQEDTSRGHENCKSCLDVYYELKKLSTMDDDIEDIDIDSVSDITEIRRLYSLLQQKEVGLEEAPPQSIILLWWYYLHLFIYIVCFSCVRLTNIYEF